MAPCYKKRCIGAGMTVLYTVNRGKPVMPWCMHRDIDYCACPQLDHIIFGENGTYYPTSKLLRVKNQLFSLKNSNVGRHIVHTVVHASSENKVYVWTSTIYNRVYIQFMYDVTYSIAGITMQVPTRCDFGVEYLHKGVSLVVHVRRAQRAIKRFLRRKWEGRVLAVMMATHARLGAGSVLERLHPDVLAAILLLK